MMRLLILANFIVKPALRTRRRVLLRLACRARFALNFAQAKKPQVVASRQNGKWKIQNSRGFSLLEVTIVTGLLSTAMLVAVISYTAIARLQQKGVAQRAVQQNGRYALEAMTRDIRNAAAVTVPAGNTSVSLTASFGNGGTVLYSWDKPSGQLNRQTCIPDSSGNPTCISSVASSSDVRVTSLSIQYFGSPGGIAFVQIDMTVEQKTVGLPIYDPYAGVYKLSTVVSPRTY